MDELNEALSKLELDLRNMQEFLRGRGWPSGKAAHRVNDVIISLGMTARTIRSFLEMVSGPQEEVEPPAEVKEEEESGEVPSEQVQQPEAGEAGSEAPVQDSETE